MADITFEDLDDPVGRFGLQIAEQKNDKELVMHCRLLVGTQYPLHKHTCPLKIEILSGSGTMQMRSLAFRYEAKSKGKYCFDIAPGTLYGFIDVTEETILKKTFTM